MDIELLLPVTFMCLPAYTSNTHYTYATHTFHFTNYHAAFLLYWRDMPIPSSNLPPTVGLLLLDPLLLSPLTPCRLHSVLPFGLVLCPDTYLPFLFCPTTPADTHCRQRY